MTLSESMANEICERIIAQGEAILKFQAMTNETNCKNRAFEFTFKGLRAICLNGGPFNSTTFDSVWDENKYDMMMPFVFDGKQWTFSMYTTKDIDLSVIAKSMGGGGHMRACGFQVAALVEVFGQNQNTGENDY